MPLCRNIAMLPQPAFHVLIPDVTRRHMAVDIRKFVLQAHSLDERVGLYLLRYRTVAAHAIRKQMTASAAAKHLHWG